nr:reverse transcriptase domain-containing protein [Tanacetum cinerariifolium]
MTLADKAILLGADNRPPMLEKDMYDSWKSRMELYMMNRQHERQNLECLKNGPLIWPTIEENGVSRPRKYFELTHAEAIQADCNCMRTRNSYFPNNSSVTIARRQNKRHTPNIVEPELRTIVAPMADNRTMEELLQASTEGFEETFGEAWERFKQMLRACPHHGFTELAQIDTFYNGLNDNDRDSLNAATGGNILSKTTREALQIIENKSNVRYSRNKLNVSRMNTTSRENTSKSDDRIDKLADQILTLVDIFAKKVVTPASVKVVEESCVTYGGAHAYYNCPNTDSNQPSVCAATGTYNQVAPQNRASNFMEPPGFAPRLNDQKLCEKATNQMEKFFQIFQDLHFDISFADALLLMPKFASTIKSLLTYKDKLFELAKIPLNEICLAMLLKKLPEKLGDPGKFLIPYDFLGMDEILSFSNNSSGGNPTSSEPKKTSWEQFSSNIATVPRSHGGSIAQTRSEMVPTPSYDLPLLGVYTPGSDEEIFKQHDLTGNVQQQSNDPPLSRGHTLKSEEVSIELIMKLMETCTNLSERVLALKESKTAQDFVITRLKFRVKKLVKKKKKERTKIEEIDQDAGVTLVQISNEDQGKVTPTQVSALGEAHSQEYQPEDHLGVLSATKVLADAARKNVQTNTRRRMAVSTSCGRISTASRLFRTAEEPVSTAGALMSVSTAGMVQEVNISIPSPVAVKGKGKGKMEEYEDEQTKRTKLQQEQNRLGYEAAMRLQEELDEEERERMARVHEAA